MKPGAILATNTSSIPLQDLRTTLKSPERLVGLHFFNPVSRLQLVEVVSHDGTDPQMQKQALAFVGAIDRLPLPVKSSPGFLVNRALDALHARGDGDAGRADRQAHHRRRSGKISACRWGRSKLADQVGLDICLAVGDMLRSKFGDSLPADAGVAAREGGRRRSRPQDRQGVLYLERRQARQDVPFARHGAADGGNDRPAYAAMSNVCVACLREGIVDNVDVVDGAMIFGTGYAPFRGGPLNYARSRGTENVVSTLRALAQNSVAGFTPDAGWDSFK